MADVGPGAAAGAAAVGDADGAAVAGLVGRLAAGFGLLPYRVRLAMAGGRIAVSGRE
jgi:hypothetical protein